MMKPKEVQDLWAKTLEGGRFEQGRGVLHDEETDKRCCLGVLCTLYEENVEPLENSVFKVTGFGMSGRDKRKVISYNGNSRFLPSIVSKWAGLSDGSGTYKESSNIKSSLTSKNDTGYNFNKIASLIRKGPKGLFDD